MREQRGTEPSGRTRAVFALAVPILALALCLVAGEVAFHLVPNSYRELVPWRQEGQWHTPGERYVYRGAYLRVRQPPEIAPNVITWNRGGWHDRDHNLAASPDVARVLVLGDSYVEGIQVRLEELYHRRLEVALAGRSAVGVETIALGRSGWGQVHELDALRTTGLAYHPDLIIAEFLPANDVRNNHPELERMAAEQIAHSTRARELFIESVNRGWLLPAFLCDKLDQLIRLGRGQADPIDADAYRAAPAVRPDLWVEAWAGTATALAEMKTLSARAGADLVVVVFTGPWELEVCDEGAGPPPHDIERRLPTQKVLEICAPEEISCLDLQPRFARTTPGDPACPHLTHEVHWSRHGHRRAAEETVHFLVEESDVWEGVVARVAGRRQFPSDPAGI